MVNHFKCVLYGFTDQKEGIHDKLVPAKDEIDIGIAI